MVKSNEAAAKSILINEVRRRIGQAYEYLTWSGSWFVTFKRGNECVVVACDASNGTTRDAWVSACVAAAFNRFDPAEGQVEVLSVAVKRY